MKKLLSALFFINVWAFAYSQKTGEDQVLKPVIMFSSTVHDFGSINEVDGNVSYSFEVTNAGNADLLITQVQGSCGCTIPEWSKTPIAPGEKGFVSVTYNPANRPGTFSKTITVSNNSGEPPVALSIKGTVVRKDAKQEKHD